MLGLCPLTLCPPPLSSVKLPGGCGDESGPQRPTDKRPHDCRGGPGQAQAVRFPAAGPQQRAQQKGAAPHDDAAGPRRPLAPAGKSHFVAEDESIFVTNVLEEKANRLQPTSGWVLRACGQDVLVAAGGGMQLFFLLFHWFPSLRLLHLHQ